MDGLPFSQAAQNNEKPIADVLAQRLADAGSVLEIGSGTGQHAVAFARRFPHLRWQPSEHPDALATLRPRCSAARLSNLASPLKLDISALPWSVAPADAVYTANTLHIVSADIVERFFSGCGAMARSGDRLLVYGPFNYRGSYTSESNQQFDAWLKARNPDSGIRDFAWVDGLARAAGYRLLEDKAMPANNRLLCWEQAPAT